eukprot:3323840-Ditylum_brightwellii.AAC.1
MLLPAVVEEQNRWTAGTPTVSGHVMVPENGTSAFKAGCQEGSEDRFVAGVLAKRRLGRKWVPKSDQRMEMGLPEIRLERIWETRLDQLVACNSVRQSEKIWEPWMV